ncbi:hypothetical protein MKW98_017716 [Papaver atlanticum]|uniref:Uncharacterized protein n=1 Tax=Papaver atlanticum TaxID=357466 RepID=A0AAD4TEK1_9MAGN|nr:hypothetical protein MKW98_017716 [Papaver atlanticum]
MHDNQRLQNKGLWIDRERKGVGSYVHPVNLVLWKVILFEHQVHSLYLLQCFYIEVECFYVEYFIIPMRSHRKEQQNC